MERNAKFFLDNQEQTENGTIYRDKNYKAAPDNEIVYICEFDLGVLQSFYDDGENLTEEEMLERGIGDTKATIRRTIKDYWINAIGEWIDRHDLISKIIEACSWESPATMIDQMGDWDEIWEDYPEEN